MRVFGNILRYLLLKSLHLIYGFFHSLMKKNHNTFFFISSGRMFNDNIRVFYDYVSKLNNQEVILLIFDKSLFNQLKATSENIYYAFSFSGFYQFLKHQKIIIDNGDARLFFFPYYLHPKFQIIINLWHGIPLKRLGKTIDKRRKDSFDIQFQTYSYFIVSSEFEKELIKSCYSVDKEILVTGSPRNDYFFQIKNNIHKEYTYLSKKVILYAPTWREYENNSSFFPFEDKDLNKLNKFLEDNDTYILLRGHYEEMSKVKFIYDENKFNRILPAHSEIFPDTHSLLVHVDILVTDYSSIYLDFLLLDKPIIFIPYDINEYIVHRGFLFDYEEYTPGVKVNSQKSFIRALNTLLKTPEDNNLSRKEMSKMFHKFQNGGSCKRIYDKIKLID